MSEVLPTIEKSEVKKGANGMVLESKYLHVQGETLKEVKKVFDEEWKDE